jgi:N-acetylneuraminic acid mutarotase
MITVKGKSKEEILEQCKLGIDTLNGVSLKATSQAFKEIIGRIDEFLEQDCVSIRIGLNEKYKTDIYIKFKFKDERLAWELDVYGDGEANWDKIFIIDKSLKYGLYLTKNKKVIHCKSGM